jgi:hypothetical protein
VPASCYQPSPRSFPLTLPPLPYGPEDAVRKVQADGAISFGGRDYFISHGLHGHSVAVRRTEQDGIWTVWYCQRQVATIDRGRHT